jgi:hypothetical protein
MPKTYIKYKSFLPVEAEITVTKVFITPNMKNSKSHCKQEVDVGKPGKRRHGTSHHAKAIYQI